MENWQRPAGLTAAALGLLLLNACTGGGGASPAPTATPATLCTLGTGASIALVYPAPASTGNANVTTLYVATSGTIASGPSLQVETATGTIVGGTFQLQQLANGGLPPAGSATPPFPPAYYYSQGGFALTAGNTYTVYLLNSAQSGCTPSPIGSAVFQT